MPANDQVNIKVGFTVDKTGLDEIQTALRQITKQTAIKVPGADTLSEELQAASTAANELQGILTKSWNTQLNQLDISKFQQQLEASGLSLQGLANTFDAAGEQGTLAFNKLATAILNTNAQVKQSNQFLNSMADTLSKTIKWTAASSAIRKVTSSIREAWNFTKDLDESLNNIRIVTGKSTDEMAEFAVQANNAAKAMGATTTDYTNASLIFYQQGLSDEEAQARTDVVTKVANVTGQAASEVADNLTAVWNGYQVTAEQAEESIDILAAVAANTASNLEELSTGMTKVAAAANEMGVGEEQLASQISTIVSATRQAPETVGQALKTVYARMSTINAGGEDEDDGATLTSYSAKMAKFGINVLDTNGKLRDMGDVIEEIGGKWEDFSRETQVSLAQAMAGTRQYVNIMALFENWDKYESTLEIANNSMGTLQQQQDIYMESTEAHLNKLTASTESLYMTLFDTSSINKLIDLFTIVIDRVNNLMSSMGGGMQTLVNLVLLVANIFSNQLATGMTKFIDNQKVRNANEEYYKTLVQSIADLQQISANRQLSSDISIVGIGDTAALNSYQKSMEKIASISKNLSTDQQKSLQQQAQELANIEGEIAKINAQKEINAKHDAAAQEDAKITSVYLDNLAETEQMRADNAKIRQQTLANDVPLVAKLTQDYKEQKATETDIELLEKSRAAIVEALQYAISDTSAAEEEALVTDEQREILEKAIKAINDEGYITDKARADIAVIINDLRKQHVQKEEELREQAEATRYIEENKLDLLKSERDYRQANLDKTVEQTEVAQQLSAVMSTISTLAISISQIQGIVNIITNEDLTNGQKVVQILTTLSMMIPMVVSMFRKLKEEIEKSAVAMEFFHAAVSGAGIVVEVLIAAFVTLGVIIGKQIVNYVNRYKIALEEATTSSEELAEATDAITQSLTNLQNAIDTYDDVKSTLDDCVEGTEDWEAALKDANEAALDLLNTINDLNGAGLSGDQIRNAYNTATGEFDQDVLDQINKNLQRSSDTANLASAYGNYNASMAGIELDLRNLLNESYIGDSFLYLENDIDKITNHLNEFVNTSEEEASQLLKNLGIGVHMSTEDFNALIPEIIDLAEQADAAAGTLEAIAGIDLQDYLINNEDNEESIAAENIVIENIINDTALDNVDLLTDYLKYGGVNYSDEQKETLKDLGFDVDSLNTSIAKSSNENNEIYQTIIKRLQELGFSYTEVTGQKAVTGTDKNRSFSFIDENGEQVSYQANTVANWIATGTAMENAGVATEEVETAFENLNEQLGDTSNSIYSFINNGNLEELSKNEYEELQNAFNGLGFDLTEYFSEEKGTIDEETEEWIQQVMKQWLANFYGEDFEELDLSLSMMFDNESLYDQNYELANQIAAALDIQIADIPEYLNSTALTMILADLFGVSIDKLSSFLDTDSLMISIDKYGVALEHITDDMFSAVQESFNEMDLSDVSLTTSIQIANIMESAFESAGQAGLDAITAVFNGMDISSADDFIAVLDSLDESWGTVSVSQFKEELDKAKISLDIDDDSLYNFVAALNATADAANSAIASLDNFNENFASIAGTLDGLSRNDTLSDDDYQTLQETLSAYGVSISQFFATTLEGTHKLITDAETFKDTVYSNLFDNYIASVKQQAEDLSNFINVMSGENTWDYYTTRPETFVVDAWTDEATNVVLSYTYNGQDISIKDFQSQQLELISTWYDLIDAEDEDRQKLIEWQKEYDQYGRLLGDSAEAISDVCDGIAELCQDEDFLNEKLEESNETLQQFYSQVAFSCTSIDELNQALEAGYTDLDSYNAAWDTLWQEQRTQDLDTEEISDYANYLYELIKASDEYAEVTGNMTNDDLQKYLKECQNACKEWAIEIMNMNDAIEDLSDNLEDYIADIQDSTTPTEKQAKAFTALNEDLQKLLNTSQDFSLDFIDKNLDDLRLAAEGDEEAIERLRAAALDAIILDIEASPDIDFSYWGNDISAFESDIYGLQDFLNSYDWTVNPQMDLTDLENGGAAFIENLDNLIDATGMASWQVQALLAGMGYNVEFQDEVISETEEVPVYRTHHWVEAADPVTFTYQNDAGEDVTQSIPQWYTYEATEQVDTIPAEGSLYAASEEITTADGYSGGGDMNIRHVKNITKQPSATASNYSTVNRSSTPSTSSGGSNGSSGSTSEPKQEDHIEDQSDRYHDINLRLQDISTSLARIQRQESKLLGQALIDNLNAQLATLDDYIDATTVKIEIATQEAAELRAELSSQGVTFDSNGYISNYQAAMDAQLATVNAVIDKYNGMSAEQQEAYQDTLDAAKDAYNDFVENLNNYDTLIHETIPGLEDDITDALDQEIQIQISKFTMEIEIRLDMKEAENDWNKFYRKIILGMNDDDLVGNALEDYLNYQTYYNTNDSGTGTIQTLTQQLNDTLDQLKQYDKTGWMSVYGDDQAQALEDLQTYYTELMTELEDAEDLIEDLWDTYLDSIDKVIDAFDDHIDQYDVLADQLEHDMNLIELLYGEEAYDKMNAYYQQIYDNDINRLSVLRGMVDYYQKMMDAATDDEEYKKWRDAWEDALEEMNDMLEQSIQDAIDLFDNAINQIIDNFNASVTNGLGLDFLGEQWDLLNDEADIYLNKIDAIYSVSDLKQKYLDAIDATDSISAQQKLNALMEEQLSYLTEKENLTQYDIDRAELEYEIMLKQIALEEAQQNKSSMRLRRDAQGNYTYQYVSDEEEIAGLQSELLDLQNQLYDLDLNNYKENLNNLYNYYEEFQERLYDLWTEYYVNQSISEEEYEAERAEIIERYESIIQDYATETAVARQDLEEDLFEYLAALYANDPELFQAMLDEETAALLDFGDSTGKSAQELYEMALSVMNQLTEDEREAIFEEMVPYAQSGIAEMAETIEDFISQEGNTIKDFFLEEIDAMDAAFDEFKNNVDAALATADVAVDELTEGYDEVTDALREVIAASEDVVSAQQEEMSQVYDLWNSLQDLIQAYKDAEQAAISAAQASYSYWQAANQQAAESASSNKTSSSSASSSSSSKSSSSSSSSSSKSSSSSSTQGNGKVEKGDKVIFESGSYYYDSYGTSPSGTQHHGEYVYVTNYKTDGRKKPIHISTGKTLGSGDLGWLEQSQISGYESGGYTGEWQDKENDGALAILHQKELVLNQNDTKNLLTAVGIVRDVADVINNLNTHLFDKVNSLMSLHKEKKENNGSNNIVQDISDLIENIDSHLSDKTNAMMNIQKNKDNDKYEKVEETLEQDVHIDATFPNITNSHEIEEAFNNLVNIASQYANRTNARR